MIADAPIIKMHQNSLKINTNQKNVMHNSKSYIGEIYRKYTKRNSQMFGNVIKQFRRIKTF